MSAHAARALASRAEDAAAAGDRAGALAAYEEAMALDPANARYAAAHASLEGADAALDTLFENMALNKAAQRVERRAPAAAAGGGDGEFSVAERLTRCAERGDVSGLRALAGAGADVNAGNDLRYGDAALHAARDARTAAALLDLGAAVDGPAAPRARGWTPLAAAVRFGRGDVAELLLARGADADATRRDGPDAGANVLMGVTRGSALAPDVRRRLAEMLLARGADARAAVAATDWSALHDAVESGDAAVADLLLAAGANVNATSTDVRAWDAGSRCTPYDIALGHGFDDLAAALAARGGAKFGDLHAFAGPQGRV